MDVDRSFLGEVIHHLKNRSYDGFSERIGYAVTSPTANRGGQPMDTEKKSEKEKQPTQDIAAIVGDLVVSGATMLAHSAAEAVVKRVKKAAADSAPVQAVAKVVKKAKKSPSGVKTAATKKGKATKASRKSGTKKVGKKKVASKAGNKPAKTKKATKKKAAKKSKR